MFSTKFGMLLAIISRNAFFLLLSLFCRDSKYMSTELFGFIFLSFFLLLFFWFGNFYYIFVTSLYFLPLSPSSCWAHLANFVLVIVLFISRIYFLYNGNFSVAIFPVNSLITLFKFIDYFLSSLYIFIAATSVFCLLNLTSRST